MSKNNLIIIGVDPGTTLGYAILDIDGNILKIGSSKQLDLNSLITEVIFYGECVVVGSDVKKTPSFVKNFSRKLGARLIAPEYDLKIDEKRKMVKGASIDNSHQRDALASAYYAYKKIKPTLNKIDNYLEKEGKESMKNEVKKSLIKHNSSSITDIIKKNKTKIDSRKNKRKKIRVIYVRDTSFFLRSENIKLNKKIRYLETKLDRTISNVEKLVNVKIGKLTHNRENNINSLQKQVKELNIQVKKLQDVNNLYKKMVSNTNFIVAKKIKNLRNKTELNDKILFVEDPNLYSAKNINLINKNIEILIYKKKPSAVLRECINCILFNSTELDYVELDDIVFLNKAKFNMEKSKINILTKVVRDYKKERSSQIT